MKNPTLIITDDHKLFAEGLERILTEENFEVLGICSNDHELLAMLNGVSPDLIIMDIQMAGMDGLKLCYTVKQAHPAIKIILISMFESNTIIKEVKAAGGDGYIPKTTNADQVKITVEKILGGEQIYLKPQTLETVQGLLPNLQLISKREKDIIALTKNGYTAKMIAQKLNISQFTIETHRRNILKKLNLKSVKDLIAFAYQYNF